MRNLQPATWNSQVREWHIITGEYPPQFGGVSHYTRQVAAALARAGDSVHVWCPPADGETPSDAGVIVHRELGSFTPRDLHRVGRSLSRFQSPRQLLVQWVPHSFGYRSMNLLFCAWLWDRALRKGDHIELMVHEPYLPFAGTWKQHGAALIHRLMTVLLLRAPRKVWLAIPAWQSRMKPYALGRNISYQWLPLPSNIPEIDDPGRPSKIRAAYAAADCTLLGHYGTYAPQIFDFLLQSLSALLPKHDHLAMLLMGPGSHQLRDRLVEAQPELSERVHATGVLSESESAQHMSACDIMLQPYPDGVSSRRTTMMAGLFLQLPTVTTSGELTEALWADSGAVALAPAGNVAAFVASVEELLKDPQEQLRMSSASGKLYQEHFDLQHIIGTLRSGSQ